MAEEQQKQTVLKRFKHNVVFDGTETMFHQVLVIHGAVEEYVNGNLDI
jgi:hypothetical protein